MEYEATQPVHLPVLDFLNLEFHLMDTRPGVKQERYLTVSSKDGRHAIRFMTSDDKIGAIISGTAKSVKYVEGCL